MKKFVLFLLLTTFPINPKVNPIEFAAALRDKTLTITTTNWTVTQVHQYYDDFLTWAMAIVNRDYTKSHIIS